MTKPGGGWLRRAGRLALPDGGDILWSVAQGRRGRRWRSLRRDAEGRIVSDLLLELDPEGDWVRLELATRAGILTLHPDGPEVHGNAVTPEGVRHLRLPWGSGCWLSIDGEPAADVALAFGTVGGSSGLVIRPSLEVEAVGGLAPKLGAVPADGLPGPSWPLELPDMN